MNTDAPHILPTEGFLRKKHILGDPKADPPTLPIIPVSDSAWWDGVRTGRYPKPVRHHGITMWRVADIRSLIARINEEAEEHPYETD